MTEENHENTTVSLVGTGIRTRDLPNASLVRYHGATSLGKKLMIVTFCNINFKLYFDVSWVLEMEMD